GLKVMLEREQFGLARQPAGRKRSLDYLPALLVGLLEYGPRSVICLGGHPSTPFCAKPPDRELARPEGRANVTHRETASLARSTDRSFYRSRSKSSARAEVRPGNRSIFAEGMGDPSLSRVHLAPATA